MDNRISTFEKQVLYLIHCSLMGKTPKTEALRDMDYEALLEFATKHKIASMLSVPVELMSGDNPDLSINLNDWLEYRNRIIRNNLLMEIERSSLNAYMEENGIWYMPLKGIILKDLYPRSYMREMCDNDILFDKTYAESIRDYLQKHGYNIEKFGVTNHDVYVKEPIYCFEMHRTLFNMVSSGIEKYEYYLTIKDRLLLKNGSNFEYRFSDEDFYIYLIAHGHKHLSNSGTGLRTLVDIFLYLKKYNSNLNWDYIESELRKIKLDNVEKFIRTLSCKLFETEEVPVLSDIELETLKYIISCGAYGNVINKIRLDLQKKDKYSYIKERFFLTDDALRIRHPFYYKHKYLLPIWWVKRLIKGIFKNRKKLIYEFKYLIKH